MILYVPSSWAVTPSNMRLMTRVEFRSVIWGGSIVTGSARRPITIASFGGAATATDTSSTATSPNPIPHARRLDMRASSGIVKCPASCPNHLGLATARRGAKIPAWEDHPDGQANALHRRGRDRQLPGLVPRAGRPRRDPRGPVARAGRDGAPPRHLGDRPARSLRGAAHRAARARAPAPRRRLRHRVHRDEGLRHRVGHLDGPAPPEAGGLRGLGPELLERSDRGLDHGSDPLDRPHYVKDRGRAL